MDPVSIVVSAVVAGASATLKGVASEAIKDAYSGLKALIAAKFGHNVDLDAVEKRPDHERQQEVLADDLRKAGADAEPEVLLKAKTVLEGVEDLPAATAQSIGVDLERVKSHLMEIRKITAAGGIGLRARDSEIETITIEEIDAGKK